MKRIFKSTVILALMIVFGIMTITAQTEEKNIVDSRDTEIYFPTRIGTKLNYGLYDGTGKLNFYLNKTISEIEYNEDVKITYTYRFTTENNIFVSGYYDNITYDSDGFINIIGGVIKNNSDPNYPPSSWSYRIPTDLPIGYKYKSKGNDRYNYYGTITVEAIEPITVKAGTFECVKLSFNAAHGAYFLIQIGFEPILVQDPRLFIERPYHWNFWIAKGVGIVKIRAFKKNKLISEMELESITQLEEDTTQWNVKELGSTSDKEQDLILRRDGTLTISGTGDMPDIGFGGRAAWYDIRSSITSVIIENGITKIGNYTFLDYKNITSVTLAESVTNIGSYAFARCKSLSWVEVKNPIPPKIGISVFNTSPVSMATLIVPSGAKVGYALDKWWKKFGTIEEQ